MENTELLPETTLEESTVVEKDIQENLNHYYHDPVQIDYRLSELEHELDLESYLQTETAALTIAGVILGFTVNKNWFVLPLAASLLSVTNLYRGSNRPLSFFRRLGFRTKGEIEKEKYALKAIRGDFKLMIDVPNAVWTAVNK